MQPPTEVDVPSVGTGDAQESGKKKNKKAKKPKAKAQQAVSTTEEVMAEAVDSSVVDISAVLKAKLGKKTTNKKMDPVQIAIEESKAGSAGGKKKKGSTDKTRFSEFSY